MAKFRGIRSYVARDTEGGVLSFLTTELFPSLRDLFVGLYRLDFLENFPAFEWRGTIAAGVSVDIPHPLGLVPTRRIIVRQTGNTVIADGDTAWTIDRVSLKNVGSNTATLTVIFMR